MSQIQDGTGTGSRAKVGLDNRLEVRALMNSGLHKVSFEDGKLFYIETDFIPVTTVGVLTGILYVKNTGNENLHLWKLRTCGTVLNQWKLIKNPSAGTLVSDAVPAYVTNTNFTSGNTLDSDAFKGAEGKTVTDGSHVTQWTNNIGHSLEDLDGALILGKNDSIALVCKVAVAGEVCVHLIASTVGSF